MEAYDMLQHKKYSKVTTLGGSGSKHGGALDKDKGESALYRMRRGSTCM